MRWMVVVAVLAILGCERGSEPGSGEEAPSAEASAAEPANSGGRDETGSGEPKAGGTMAANEPEETRDPAADPGFVDVSQYMEPVEPREKRLAFSALELCELDAQGVPHCMGEFSVAPLEDGTVLEEMTAIQGLPPLRYIDAGGGICGLDEGGQLHCFGAPFGGRRTNSPYTTPLQPVAFPDFGRAVAVDLGSQFGCLLRADGHVDCFGEKVRNGIITPEAGRGFDVFTNLMRVPELRAGSIDCATYHCCAVTVDETGVCWGGDSHGEVGHGRFDFADPTPIPVHGLPEKIRAIGAGHNHSCALDSEGAVYCWGFRGDRWAEFDDWRKRGGPPADAAFLVREIEKGVQTRWLQLDPAEFGVDYCERDDREQAGSSAVSRWPCSLTAHRIDGVPKAVDIAVGYLHACALTAEREVYCWGVGDDGVLGVGTTPESAGPTRVDIDAVDALMTRGRSTCAVKGSELWCWGGYPAGISRDDRRYTTSPERILPR